MAAAPEATVEDFQRIDAGFSSEALVLGALDNEKDVALLRPDRDCRVGDRIA